MENTVCPVRTISISIRLTFIAKQITEIALRLRRHAMTIGERLRGSA